MPIAAQVGVSHCQGPDELSAKLYSQCDQALPCSSCFFRARASIRRRSEHSSQIVVSEGLPHRLQTFRSDSDRGSDGWETIFIVRLLLRPRGGFGCPRPRCPLFHPVEKGAPLLEQYSATPYSAQWNE